MIDIQSKGYAKARGSFRNYALYLKLDEDLKNIMALESIVKLHASEAQEDGSECKDEDWFYFIYGRDASLPKLGFLYD